jgi:hypothetical protein
MANGIDWFRWHHGSVNDPKFGLVAKKAGARVGDVIAVWALVLELASANADRGQVDEIDHETTDFLLGAEDGTTARILEAMEGRGLLVSGRVARWDARQPKREDSTAAERKQRQRQRDKEQTCDMEGVTPSHATSRQFTPRGEERREEEIKPKAKSKAEAAPASRLPADWMPSLDDARFCEAERPDLSIDATAARFRDYWIAQPGAKGRKTDWSATWRNWVRNEKATQQARASPRQAAQANMQRLHERIHGAQHHEPDPRIIDINDRPAGKVG